MISFLNKIASRLVKVPVQIQLDLNPGLLIGRLSKAQISMSGVSVNGLLLKEVNIEIEKAALVPSWPLRLKVKRLEAHVHLDQSSLDAWSKSAGLPVRLRLRPGRVVARTGIAGLRLSEADMDVKLEDRILRLVPRRINVLGMEASGGRLGRIALPLPQLPRDARLVALEPQESALRARIAVDNLDEEVTKERLKEIKKMASRVMTNAPDRKGGAGDRSKYGQDEIDYDAEGAQARPIKTRPINSRPDSRPRPRPLTNDIIEATVLDVSNYLRDTDNDGRKSKDSE